MELHELHVLHRQAGAQHHAAAVTGTGVSRRAREVRATIATSRENRLMTEETMHRAVRHIDGHDATALAVLHDQVDGEIFDEELRFVTQRLLIQRMQHRVAGAVRRCASTLRGALAVVRRHAAEGTLINATVVSTRERHAVVLEFDHRARRFFAHEFDGVLVAEPVRPFDGVVHVPAPIVLAHVAERGADATLRGHRVTARREDFRQTRDRQTGMRQTESGTQAGAAGADHDHVVVVIDELIGAHAALPNAMRSTEKMPRAPNTI